MSKHQIKQEAEYFHELNKHSYLLHKNTQGHVMLVKSQTRILSSMLALVQTKQPKIIAQRVPGFNIIL